MANMFKLGQTVRHVKTNTLYIIVHTPNFCRIEEANTPAYVYRSLDSALLWVRAQVIMEDGRFEEYGL